MVVPLLTISFILHIITLLAIYLLFQQYKKINKADSKEIIELMETYLEEIKEENLRLQKQIQSLDKQKDSSLPKESIIQTEPTKENKVEIPHLSFTETINDHVEASLEGKVLQLYHQGKNIDEIAKQLNCGKTEAELIIKFQQKK